MGAGAFLKKTAPWISTILGVAGTATGVPFLGVAARALGEITGKPVPSNVGAINDALAGLTPEQYVLLKEKDADVGVQMQKLGYEHQEELLRVAADDRASARDREKSVRDWMPKALGLGALVVFSACMFLLIFYELPQSAKEVVVYMLGILSGMVKDVYGYFFGSSSGSDEKTKIIAKQKEE